MSIRTSYTFALILLCLVRALPDSQTAPTAAATSAVYTGIVVDCSGSQRLQMDRGGQRHQTNCRSDAGWRRGFRRSLCRSGQDICRAGSHKRKIGTRTTPPKDLYIEGGQTSLFDAVDYAAKYFAKSKAAESGCIVNADPDQQWRGQSRHKIDRRNI